MESGLTNSTGMAARWTSVGAVKLMSASQNTHVRSVCAVLSIKQCGDIAHRQQRSEQHDLCLAIRDDMPSPSLSSYQPHWQLRHR